MQAAPQPAPPRPTDDELAAMPELQRELLRKMQLETAMSAAPGDQGLRREYFDLLLQFAGCRTGLSHALLPELGQPLHFRCGSIDVFNLSQVFRDGAYGFPMRATPLRILQLGAYCGYAAVYLAHRFPQAQILCVEPCASNFRMLSLNTTPLRRIRVINVAAWHSATRLGVKARYYGDWGIQLHDALPEEARVIPACSVPELLQMAGWERADMVLSDIEGAEAAVFADPTARWLHGVDVVAVDTHEAAAPNSAAVVAACFDPTAYERTQHGETTLFQRRVPFRALARAPVPELPLVSSEPGLLPIALQDVSSAAWGFFTFDSDCCQLHPNPPGEAPARAIFPRSLDGQGRFSAILQHAGRPSAGIVFSVIIQREDGGEVWRVDRLVEPQGRMPVDLELPGLSGRHRIVLQTAMAPGAANNFNGWARWLNPRLS